MSLFSTIGSYEDAWKAIIMPFRQEYSLYDLGPTEFNVKDNRIKRADFRLLNKQGQVLECSYFQQANIDTPVPCVVYLHGNGCSRIEALSYTNLILSQPVSFFCFDFRGCGKSDGEYTSVGWHEQEDLECVIQYLCNTGKVSKVAVWGRSMGAVTAILYANKDPRIDCFILDSPFSNFKQLVKELAKQKAFIPGFLVAGAFGIIRKTILKKANFDIDALRPIKYVDKIKIPALFGAAKDDSFVAAKHTKDLYMAYGGPKQLMLFDGDHNSQRPFNWMILVQDFIKTHLLGEKSEPQHVAKPFKQAVNPAEKPMESPVEPKIELNANTNQNAAKEVTPVRKAAPVQKPQFQTQMSFSWLDHSASSPNLVVKSPSQPSFSEKAEKEPAVEEKLQHETTIPSEKRLQNLFAGKKENIPVRPPQFAQQSQTPKSALINLDITPKSSNKSDKSPTLKEHSKPPLKFALKENYGPGEKENGERLVKNTSSINLSSNSNISIFGPKKREIHSENIIGSPLRQVFPPKSNISLKEISSFQLNNASNIEAGATTPHQKVNATTIVEQDKSPVQKPNMSNLEIPMSSVQQSRSRERKNLTLIPNMLPLPLRKADSQRDPKRIFDTGAQTSKDKTASTRSPNKSFTIDLKNLKLTKENSSPTPKQKGLVLQVKLNSDIPIISPHQAGSHVNLSYLTHSLNNVKQMDSRRNSETIAKSYNGLPGAENVKPSTGIFNEPKGYRDNMKLPVNLMENPIIKFSSELPPKGPQREVRKRHELVK